MTRLVPFSTGIRAATPGESSRIKQLVQESGRWIDYWDSGALIVLYRADSGAIMGWARHWPTPQGRHGVMSVTVDGQYRGKKLGLALVSHLIASLPDIGRWHLDCAPSLAPYYERIGFKIVARAECPEMFDGNDPADQLCMACAKEDFVGVRL